jgi:hypothetical protein
MMTNDRDIGSIWFLYKERLTTRQELQGELDRLQRHGWIDRTPQDRWLITDAGREALSAVQNWVFRVHEILDQEEGGREVVVRGRLTAGSVAFFLIGFFYVTRHGADIGGGFVNGVGTSEDSANPRFVALLTLLGMDDRLRQGDVLRMQDPVTR